MSLRTRHFYRFGEFTIDAEQRVLLRAGKPAPLTPKVFETLLVLVEGRGRIVDRDELMRRLWPNSFVEESNLTFNIRQLRKALGDDARRPIYIETVARRGYRFIADAEEILGESHTGPGGARLNGSDSALPQIGAPGDASTGGGAAHDAASAPEVSAYAPAALHGTPARAFGRPLLIARAAVAAVLLLAGGLFAWHFGMGPYRGRGDNWLAGAGAPAPTPKLEQLTATGKYTRAANSADGQYVAYTSAARGRESIWLRQLATSACREIISFADGRIYGLAFAHGGAYLYFVKGGTGPAALYRVALPLGGPAMKLIGGVEGSFSLSPDDSRVAFIRYSDDDKECALMIADAEGQHERTLAVRTEPDWFNTPAWSPDGQSIVVAVGPTDRGAREVRLVEYRVTGGAEREVSAGRWFYIARVAWLPDKSGLIVVGAEGLLKPKQLWRVAYPGGAVRRLTDGLEHYTDISLTADASLAVAPLTTHNSALWVGSGADPQSLKWLTEASSNFCWTADGRLLYSSNVSYTQNLWAMRPDGAEPEQLTAAGMDGYPAATRDGRYIAFTSSRTGTLQIWRMNADGSNQVQLTNGVGANFPAVSPDGQWVIYNNVNDWHLWRVPIEGGAPAPLTDYFAFAPAMSPDGKLIACFGRGDKRERKLLVIPFDGGAPLREFALAAAKLPSDRLRWTADASALLYAAAREGSTIIYRQALAGGPAENVATLDEDDVFDFGYSPDGQHLAVMRSSWQYNLALLSDFKQ